MSFDTEVLVIKTGMSGLGLAVQIIRKYGIRNIELIEKSGDVGGMWRANTYPGCGYDVASHFYSYSFWSALIPKTKIGCKRKVLDTDYLKTLWRDNVELLANDPVDRITETGVVTRSGREVKADAIVLAIGFVT